MFCLHGTAAFRRPPPEPFHDVFVKISNNKLGHAINDSMLPSAVAEMSLRRICSQVHQVSVHKVAEPVHDVECKLAVVIAGDIHSHLEGAAIEPATPNRTSSKVVSV